MKQAECRGIPLSKGNQADKGASELKAKLSLQGIHFEHLAFAVGATMWACNVRRDTAFTLRTSLE